VGLELEMKPCAECDAHGGIACASCVHNLQEINDAEKELALQEVEIKRLEREVDAWQVTARSLWASLLEIIPGPGVAEE